MDWAREVQALGAGEIVLTSMDADGTCDGYDLPVTAAVSEAVSIPVVASGGAGSPAHLVDAMHQPSLFLFLSFFLEESKGEFVPLDGDVKTA